MAAYDIGTVIRVDFTPINKKPGFIEKNRGEIFCFCKTHYDEIVW